MAARAAKRPGRMRIDGGAAFFNGRLDAALAERTPAMLQAAHRAGGAG